MSIIIKLDSILNQRGMKSNELARRIGITNANLSILKTGKAKAIRFSTLEAICDALDCEVSDIIEYRKDKENTDQNNSIMSQIHFHSDFYETIKNGNKTQTARVDEPVPELGKGEAIFDDKPSIEIRITKVKHKSFKELTIEEIKKDGFDSKEELWSVLLGFYPELKQTDHLILIEFEAV